MNNIECKDKWHKFQSVSHIAYDLRTPGPWRGTGYECKSCGFRTYELVGENDEDLTDKLMINRREIPLNVWKLSLEVFQLWMWWASRLVPGTHASFWKKKDLA